MWALGPEETQERPGLEIPTPLSAAQLEPPLMSPAYVSVRRLESGVCIPRLGLHGGGAKVHTGAEVQGPGSPAVRIPG